MAEKTKEEIEQENAALVADRARALEQVKRVYALVIGFATWSCITNAYQCGRKLLSTNSSLEPYSILVAQAFCFLSLVVLFLLGAERMLDRKYLQSDSDKPSPISFLFDLFTVGAPAVAFVIIANIFPVAAITSEPTLDGAIHDIFWWFVAALLALYALDIILLGIHGVCLNADNKHYSDLMKGYRVWIISNSLSLLAVGFILFHFKALNVAHHGVNGVAFFLVLIHGIRFVGDYFLTFHCYYPPEEIQKA